MHNIDPPPFHLPYIILEDMSTKDDRFFEYKFTNGDKYQGHWKAGKV